jgi:hypothetical protein
MYIYVYTYVYTLQYILFTYIPWKHMYVCMYKYIHTHMKQVQVLHTKKYTQTNI